MSTTKDKWGRSAPEAEDRARTLAGQLALAVHLLEKAAVLAFLESWVGVDPVRREQAALMAARINEFVAANKGIGGGEA